MIHEFNNRMSIQRTVLEIINDKKYQEELCGLSSKAIDRWIAINGLNCESDTCKIVYEISGKLFFLANKSQDCISDEYEMLSAEITNLCSELTIIQEHDV